MAEFFQVKVRQSLHGVISNFTLYYQATGGGVGPLAAQSCAAAWVMNCLAPLQAAISNNCRIESVYARRVDGVTAPAWMGNLQNAIGLAPSDAQPAMNVGIINLRNSGGALKRPGRIFLSGIGELAMLDGSLTPGYVAAQLQPWMDSLITIPNGGSPPWSGELRVRRTIINQVPQVPPVYVPVTSLDATLEFGTIRARKTKLNGYRA